jgi:LmbE family N-acetylglucosaminyl deacetylase
MSSNPYLDYVNSVQQLFSEGRNLPYGNFAKPTPLNIPKDAPVSLILSPHPDDECIIGGLPLRLMKEGGIRIINVAITLGSNTQRKQERLTELNKACEWIGFDLELTAENGLDPIRPETPEKDPVHWNKCVDVLRGIFSKYNPVAIFVPHARDWNQTHLGTHLLAIDALKKAKGLSPLIIETEYWGQMPHPNLMVENTVEEVADLLGALSHHRGELERNPFHLRLPAWMQDNVRRGAEVVGGQGGDAPGFGFATLYRVNRWEDKKLTTAWAGGKMLSTGECSKQSLLKA